MATGDLYFWRQSFVLLTNMLYSTSVGYMIAFPSVLTPYLLSPNSTVTATSDQASWIAASNGFAGMIGLFILSPILQTWGRKPCNFCCNILQGIGWIMLAFADNVPTLLAGRIIQGICIGGIYIQSMILAEYVDPKRRGYFLSLKKVSLAVGTLGCHSMSLIWDCRQIATFAIMLPLLATIQTCFWPESPSFLALKGKFMECEKSFLWLHGSTKMSELNEVISSQMEKSKAENQKKYYKVFLQKEFWKPFVIVSLLTVILDVCGRYYFVVYIIQILTELLEDKSIAIYCTVGADFFTILALVSSTIIIKTFKRRTVLFFLGFFNVVLMLLITLILILKSYNFVRNLVWLTPSILILQNFIANLGVIPLAFTLIGEVFPIELRGIGSCATGVIFSGLYTLTLKLTPVLMSNTGIQGTYGIYGVGMAVCLGLLYFVVPETKDKTLQQIEDDISGITRDRKSGRAVLLQ